MTFAADIYCGLGGWTEGFLAAGYRVFGFDNHRHEVYLVTCHATGMRYVGITTQGIRKRWNNHVNGALSGRQKTPLHRDISSLGVGQFTIEHVFTARTLRDLWESEKVLIDQWATMAPGGYNLARGGGVMAYTRTPESIERSAAKHRGVPRNPEVSERAAQKIRGTKRSPETRAKMAEVGRNRIFSKSTRDKMAAFRVGKSTNSGEVNGQSKLTADQVREVRDGLGRGEPQASLASRYSVSRTAIWKIANGLKWKSVA